MALDKERLLSRQEQEKLQMTIDELRHSIQRSEAQFSRREQVLKQEINDLRQVCSHCLQTLDKLSVQA
jgi:predicted  nucleic acid-binding Zn-ribbon protein